MLYGYTCMDIDDSISGARNKVSERMSDLGRGLVPREAVEKYVDLLMEDLTPIFELVRNTNVELRSSAESEIDRLKTKLKEYESEIKRT